MGKRIVVTGGAGFIGSHLVARLIEAGHEVVSLDNYFTGQKSNLDPIRDHHNFEMLRHDIVEPIMLEAEQVYNLACPASPVHYQINPIKTVKTCVMGTMNMLGLAKRVGATILQASTSEVYGDPERHPQTEDYWGYVNPIGPRSCYDEGKRVAETLMSDYHRQSRVDIRIARIFNTYGPNMALEDGRVMSNFIVQALRGEPLTVYGRGDQTRSFCFVEDMVTGLIRLMDRPGLTDPVNLGNPHEVTILELAELIIEQTGSSSEIRHHDLPQDDPVRRCPDITVARRELDWQPTVHLREGLGLTIDYFRRLIGLPGPA